MKEGPEWNHLLATEAPQQQGPTQDNVWHKVKGPKLKLKHNTTEEQVQTNEILENLFQMLISAIIVRKYFILKKDLTKQHNKDHPNTVL